MGRNCIDLSKSQLKYEPCPFRANQETQTRIIRIQAELWGAEIGGKGRGGGGGGCGGIKQKKKFAQNIQTDLAPFPALISV